MNSKIKARENKSGGTFDNPRFTLTLGHTKLVEQQINNSYETLSKLIGNSDIVIVLDTSLMNLSSTKREPLALEFLENIRALGVAYKCTKTASSPNTSLLSGFMGKKETQGFEIMAYIPHEIWVRDDFKKVLPFYGARYLVAKEKTEGSKLLDDMQKMLDTEKLDYFKLIIFSAIFFNSMGISAKYLTLSDIKNILGISE